MYFVFFGQQHTCFIMACFLRSKITLISLHLQRLKTFDIFRFISKPEMHTGLGAIAHPLAGGALSNVGMCGFRHGDSCLCRGELIQRRTTYSQYKDMQPATIKPNSSVKPKGNGTKKK